MITPLLCISTAGDKSAPIYVSSCVQTAMKCLSKYNDTIKFLHSPNTSLWRDA